MALGLALTAVASAHLGALGVALVLPGAALGALFTTLYVLVDRLSPEGAGTRTFAWLVTANNGGLAAGAAVAGPLTEGPGPNVGLWFAAACAHRGRDPGHGGRDLVRTRTSAAYGVPVSLITFQGHTRNASGDREKREGS